MALKFSKELFWDVDPDSIDKEQHARYVIERVMTRGRMEDFVELKKTYEKDRIVRELQRSRSLDPKTLNFCSAYFGINKKDFIRHRYPLVRGLVIEDEITLWSVEDIAAAKISAITKRGAKKDFYDLAEILKLFSLESVLSSFEKIYPSGERFMAMKSLSWFEDAEEEPDPVSLRAISSSEVKAIVLQAIQDL